MFRYNFRELPHDGVRFEHVASHVIGKRLTYAEVTGKVGMADRLPNWTPSREAKVKLAVLTFHGEAGTLPLGGVCMKRIASYLVQEPRRHWCG